ncbi:MAG: SDR family NAD(P)-dependent oxidoreductase [Spirochaetaceae bacterium]|nr:SDR family NAD(P)-dependent oxidoreductase [Spirochaetaceae bacterium]
MSDIIHALAAPLVRGLYLGAIGSPIVVAPGKASSVPREALVAELPGASGGLGFDEAAAAATLSKGLAAWRAGNPAALLPGCVIVSDGKVRCAYYPGAGLDEARESAAAAKGMPIAAASLRESSGPSAKGRSGAGRASATIGSSAYCGSSAVGRGSVVSGRVALVTGGAQGFGEEIVRGLVSSGALVFVADLNLSGAEKLAAELNGSEGRSVAVPVSINVSDEASVAAAFEAVAATCGGVDLVVSNAGVLKAASVLEQEAASFKFVTDVNYTGFFLVTKHAGLLMRRAHRTAPSWWADVVQINSKSGLQGSNKNGSYAGSKFGGIGLVQSFALELVEHRVKVNAICPGNFFDGPLWSDPVDGLFVQYLRSGKVPGARDVAGVKAFYEAKVPMGRGCEGRDVMRALYYIVEQEYETGQALPVTGGQVMLS